MAGEICTGWTWKRESDKPVVLEVAREVTARSESDKAELIIGNECWLNNGNSRVDVNEGRPAYVYGALHANEDNTGIHIHIEPNANVNHEDLSYQFEHYTCIGGSPSSPEKPPKFALFESKKFKNYFITWDLPEDTTDHGDESMENVVKCEYLPKTADGLPDIEISESGKIEKPNDSEIQRFVWVIPVSNNDTQKFALKAYGESYYLVFKHETGKPLLVPGSELNSEVTIFSLQKP